MCLPSANTPLLSRTNNIINNRKRPIAKHPLMKAKMFVASQVAQSQSQPQPQQSSSSSTMKTQQINTVVQKSKSVQFNNVVVVVPFEKVTLQEEKNNIWYNLFEMNQIKKDGRAIASSYRKLGIESKQEYRGFENCTLLRQRQKIMSNRCVVYAYSQGYNEKEIATIYSQTNKWSSEIAFLQAIHDYVDIYNHTNANTEAIPSITSLIPPQAHPFAIESVMVIQRKKKRERHALQQQQAALEFALLQSSQSQSSQRSQRSVSPTSTLNTTEFEFEQQQTTKRQRVY